MVRFCFFLSLSGPIWLLLSTGVKYARTYLHMQPADKHNQALYFLLVASMSFLGGNTFLRKPNCKLATCRPEYHSTSPSCRFKVPVLHLNIAIHTFHYAHHNYCCPTDWRLCYDQWDAGWLYPVFPRHGNKCPCRAGVCLYFQCSFLLNIFLFHQAGFTYTSQRVWLGTEFSSGVYILFGERIVVLLSYRWAIRVQVYELRGLISYPITGPASIGNNRWLDFDYIWCINRSQLAFAGLPLTSLDSMLATLSSSLKLLLG